MLIFAGDNTSIRHGVAASNLFVAFDSVQDAEKVLSALDGKVTVNDHQYQLAYGRERVIPPKSKGYPPKSKGYPPKSKGRPYSRRDE